MAIEWIGGLVLVEDQEAMTVDTDGWGIDFFDDNALRERITRELGYRATPSLVAAFMDDAGRYSPEELAHGITLEAYKIVQ